MSTGHSIPKRGAGRPLIAAMAILAGWVAIRATTWEPPFPLPTPETLFAQANVPAKSRTDAERAEEAPAARPFQPMRAPVDMLMVASSGELPATFAGLAASRWRAQASNASFAGADRVRLMAGHQMLFASAMAFAAPPVMQSALTAPPGRGPERFPAGWFARSGEGEPVPGLQTDAPKARQNRWSADAWLLLREGGGVPRLASVNPAGYGSDQAGAVARYSLAPGSTFKPDVYIRASKALVSGGESEGAAGASISLARSFPLRVHGEVRATDRPGGTEVRPAAFVATGLPRRKLAPGVEADAYLQAGYVGGAFETGFVDGKATLETPLSRGDRARFMIGGGAWGGAQRDAARLDIGPTASVSLSTGAANLRGSIDYRVRVAGDATPRDGVAVTLAASF